MVLNHSDLDSLPSRSSTPPLIPSNEELMRSYQRGDSSAFEVLYRRISGKLYGYLRKRLQRRELVDECFQAVFAKFHQARSQYDSNYSLEQWLYVIARSTLIDHFRKQSHEIDLASSPSVEGLELPQSEGSLKSEDLLENEEVSIPLDQLSSQQRQVVQWRVLDEISYKEIADKLDHTETSVRQAFSRAIKKLRVVLAQKVGKV